MDLLLGAPPQVAQLSSNLNKDSITTDVPPAINITASNADAFIIKE